MHIHTSLQYADAYVVRFPSIRNACVDKDFYRFEYK